MAENIPSASETSLAEQGVPGNGPWVLAEVVLPGIFNSKQGIGFGRDKGQRMQIRRLMLVLTILGLPLLCGAFPESSNNLKKTPSGLEKPIREVLARQQAAWNAGDVDSFLLGYWNSELLTFSGSGGVTRGFKGVRERYKKNYPDRQAMGQLDFRDVEISELGPEAALVLGHWRLERTTGEVGGVFSLVFRRFPEGWRIIHDHTSVVVSPENK